MKAFKKIIAVSSIFIILLMIGGYFYFDKKFTPKQNYLSVKKSTIVNFVWKKNKFSPISAMLIPVKIKNSCRTFYMQFDTGSPYTIFYNNAFDSIPLPSSFLVGEMKISSNNFKFINYGNPIDFNHKQNIIGTIGTDLLEKRTLKIDYKSQTMTFSSTKIENGTKFSFQKRHILFPIKIDDKQYKATFDTGTSAFSFITRKEIFSKMVINKSSIKKENGNSWGSTLSIYTGNTNSILYCENKKLRLNDITYIEGYTIFQYTMMKLSGMGGMLGNKLFLDKILTIDCKNKEFKID